jgi:serine/tyrosine/threonine adenylyltransferase
MRVMPGAPLHLPLRFDNRSLRALPADPLRVNQRRQVLRACYSHVDPTPVAAPHLLAWSRDVAGLLGLDEQHVRSPEFAAVFSGNSLSQGMEPTAACYGGHQFGNWAGQLGDGRAISLGEAVGAAGGRFELQLKGAGPTPYSRGGDGRAVLRSSVREFLCSEAMHHLGVPTTRALSLVGTGDQVVRDMFYDGNPRLEPGAIVCRVAPTFLRFGNFQLPAERGDVETLRSLADYAIAEYYPHLLDAANPYAAFFREVCERTARLVVSWQRVGFVHGVLNTDNMSILGLTLDYGPYGWLENYDPDWTPNTTDAASRRYRFGRQPKIVKWNLARFGEALLPLVRSVELLNAGLEHYEAVFERLHREAQLDKLGLQPTTSAVSGVESEQLVGDAGDMLRLTETDMTIFYRKLADVPVSGEALREASDQALLEPLMSAYYQPAAVTGAVAAGIAAWLRRYLRRVLDEGTQPDARREQMHRVNPKYVPRNYLAQLAIDALEQGDPGPLEELGEVLRAPYAEQPGREAYAAKRPEWARARPGCSALSCSS